MSAGSRLNALAKRLNGKTDEDLENELLALRAQLRAFSREHRTFRELAVAAVDAEVEEARKLAVNILRGIADAQGPTELMPYPNGFDPPAVQAAKLLALTNPEYRQARLAAIEQETRFSPLTHDAYKAETSRLREEIRDCEIELQRRALDNDRAAVEHKLELLEGRH